MNEQSNDAWKPGFCEMKHSKGLAAADATGDGTCLSASEQRDLLDAAGLVLIDLDGCLAFGNEPHCAASAFLARYDGRYAILSNNSTETPDGLARILARNGLKVDPRRILLAGSLMIDLLSTDHAERQITLLANDTMREYALGHGLRLCPDAGDVVALARDTTLTYDKLGRAVASLVGGAELVVSNADLTHPGKDRSVVIETGAILRMFEACIPDLAFTLIGKPSRTIFDIALARFGGEPGNAVMIGDNPKTDGLGAKGVGIVPILVGPGQVHASIAAFL